MRLRKRPWVKDEIIQYDQYYVEHPEAEKGNWHKLFKNTNKIEAEIGTGRGTFITTLAEQNPNINYIAIEQKQEVLVQAIRKANKQKLTNIKFILDSASKLEDFFAEDELSRIYLNFVDPWPKTRHAKRRLTHHHFLNIYKKILTENGEIHFKTDNELLYEFSLNEAIKWNWLLKNININLYRDVENIKRYVQTEYELKFIEQGKAIYRVEMVRNDN